MHQTLFYIPYEIFGVPVFGFGLLFFAWLALLVGYAGVLWRQGKWNAEAGWTVALSLCVGLFICWVIPSVGRPAGIGIQAYGAMMLLAILSAVGLAWWRAPAFGFSRDHLLELCFWMCLLGIIGARTFYVVEYWPEMQGKTALETLGRVLNFPQGGLVVYGSLAGGLLGALLYLRFRKMPVLRTFDLLAPCMVLGLAVGRIGCLLHGCCYGGICDPEHLNCGVCFPAGSPPYMRQLEDGKISLDVRDFYYGMQFSPETLTAGVKVQAVAPGSVAEKRGVRAGDVVCVVDDVKELTPQRAMHTLIIAPKMSGTVELEVLRGGEMVPISWVTTASAGPKSLPVYPTQIFSSVGAFCLFFVLMIYSHFRAARTRPGMKIDGEVITLMLTVYPVMRFLLETVRVDEYPFLGTGFSVSQNVSFITLAAAVLLWVWIIRKKQQPGVER